MAFANKILIMLVLVALGFLIASSELAAATATNKSTAQDLTNPMISMVVDGNEKLNARAPMSISFNVVFDDYTEFIETVREVVRDRYVHGIPVLAPQSSETPENAMWLDIRLVTGDGSITLMLEQSNLYVRGYANMSGDFWEFSDTRLIDNSNNLLFSGGYIGLERTAGVSRTQLVVGVAPFVNAVNTLASGSPLGSNARGAARSMLVLVQMVAEAARFRTISNYIAENFWHSGILGGVRLHSTMVFMQNGWGQLSTAVIQMRETEPIPNSTPLPNIRDVNPTQVYTYGQARVALGIMLMTSSTTPRTPDYGRSLMNLEYVRINNIDGEKTGNLYGTITVQDGWYTYQFYQRGQHDYELVAPGGFATLKEVTSNPPVPVSGMDTFTVYVALFDYDYFSPNDDVARGEIAWDRVVESVTNFANYDTHLEHVVRAMYGNVTVGYSVLSDALGVTVWVILMDADGKEEAHVYGTVTASQRLGGSAGSAPINLFRKASGERVQAWPSFRMPLEREVFAASTSSKLTITADLWDHNYFSSDNPIAQGSAEFTVRPGHLRQDISGTRGRVQIQLICA